MGDARTARVREKLRDAGLDAIVLTHPHDVVYASNYNSILERWWQQEPLSAVIVPAADDKPVVLLIPEANLALLAEMEGRGRPTTADEVRVFELLNFCEVSRAADPHLRPSMLGEAVRIIYERQIAGECHEDILAATAAALRAHGLDSARVAFDDLRLGWHLTRGPSALTLEMSDGLDLMMRARVVKTPEEQARLRDVGRVADGVLQASADRLRRGITWDQYQREVATLMIEMGVHPVDEGAMLFGGAFKGEFIPELFRTRHDRPLDEGQIVILETQGIYDGFWIDINRTAVLGRPTPAYQRLHDTIREAFELMVAQLRPGVNTGDLPAIALNHLRSSGVSAPEKCLVVAHGVGHMPLEIPVSFPSQGLKGARGFEIEADMAISLDCLYFGSEHGPCHMENVYIISADGAECTYATPLELMGPRL